MANSIVLCHKGSFIRRALACLTLLLQLEAAALTADCPSPPAPLASMVAAEYEFAGAARGSIRQAFIDHLAEDSWVLQPGPTPGRPFYQARPESPGTLEWFPHVADVAPSGDLGFTSGPYVYSRDGAQSFGQFLSVWRRGADCRWQVLFDGGISHPGRAEMAPVDPHGTSARAPTQPLPAAPDDLATAFQAVAGREGLAPALRTYARNQGFLLLLEGQAPLSLAAGEQRVRGSVIKGPWREAAHGASRDTTLRYALGSLDQGAYVELWQYDARTANWGLRVLMLAGR